MKKLKVFILIIVFLFLFIFINELFTQKYVTNFPEGSMIDDYYEDPENHEVIILGDCEVYANFTPMVMYKNEGITAYVRGNSHQLIWQSYGLLKETLKYEIPKVVVLNVASLKVSEPEKEPYNRLMLDKMKWSKEKIEIIKSSMTEDESFISYIFPIIRYHSRYNELTLDDLKYMFNHKVVTYNGYLINKEIKGVSILPTKKRLGSYTFKDNVIDYLDKIRELCQENNIKLVLIKAPSLYPYWYTEYDNQVRDYANKYNLDYYNFLDNIEDIGIDYSHDTYDGGLHLNLYGATKLSTYFGRILKDKYDLTDYRLDNEISDIYNQKLYEYNNAIKE